MPWITALALGIATPAFGQGQDPAQDQPQTDQQQEQYEQQKQHEQHQKQKKADKKAEKQMQPVAGQEMAINFEALNEETKKKMQRKLKEAGHYKGNVDAIVGEKTKSALKEYQRAENLEVTGALDTETARNLDLDLFVEAQPVAGTQPEAAMGERQQQQQQQKQLSEQKKRAVQEKLSSLGFYDGDIDGIIGDKSKEAIREFQENNALEVTGSLNDETISALNLDQMGQQQQQQQQPEQQQPEQQQPEQQQPEQQQPEQQQPEQQQPQGDTGVDIDVQTEGIQDPMEEGNR